MTALMKESGRLAWLTAALGEQRHAVNGLLHRLSGFGGAGSMKPSVFRKFLGTLEQIALEKDKECEIIHRIQAIEARHRSQRGCRKLKRASPRPKPRKRMEAEIVCEPEQDRSNTGWLMVIGLIYLMSGRGPKPQE